MFGPDADVPIDDVYIADLLLDGASLGRAMLEVTDASMGGMEGQLVPPSVYRAVQDQIRAQADVSGHPGLALAVRLRDGTVLDPAGGIKVLDADLELGEVSVDLGGVDGAQLLGRGLARSFWKASWGEDGSTWWFEVIDDTVTRQISVADDLTRSSHHFGPGGEWPQLADQPFASFADAMRAEGGGEQVGRSEFRSTWRAHVDQHQEALSELLELGRSRGLRATPRELRHHPLFGQHELVSFTEHPAMLGLAPVDGGVVVLGPTREVDVWGIDRLLGCLWVSSGGER